MRVGKIGVVIIGLVPFNVYGECTPTPDCADMGYTETSCSGKFVRCPFDTSKLFCAPCDSIYKYDCSGANMTGGTGAACGGKYISCECDASLGYYFDNGICTCSDITPTSCSVGAIYYADGRCSNDYVFCQNPIGVVVKNNELVMSKFVYKTWGADYADLSIINYSEKYLAKTDYEGKSNTSIIVAYYGESSVDIAGVYCYNYAPQGLESSKGDWYLPSLGELNGYIYGNYEALRTGMRFMNGHDAYGYGFWSSSERNGTYAWGLTVSNASGGASAKTETYTVACFLDIS